MLKSPYFSLSLGAGVKLNPPGETERTAKSQFLQRTNNITTNKAVEGVQVHASLIGSSEDISRTIDFWAGVSIKTSSFKLEGKFEHHVSSVRSNNSLGVVINASQIIGSEEITDTEALVQRATKQVDDLKNASVEMREKHLQEFLNSYGDGVVTKVKKGWYVNIYLSFIFQDDRTASDTYAELKSRYKTPSVNVSANAEFLQTLKKIYQTGMVSIDFDGKGIKTPTLLEGIRNLLGAKTAQQPEQLLDTLVGLFSNLESSLPDVEYDFVRMSNYTGIGLGDQLSEDTLTTLQNQYFDEVARKQRIGIQRKYADQPEEKAALKQAEEESIKIIADIKGRFKVCLDDPQKCAEYSLPDYEHAEKKLATKIQGEYIYNNQRGDAALTALWGSCGITNTSSNPTATIQDPIAGGVLRTLQESPFAFRLTNAGLIKQISISAVVNGDDYRGVEIFPKSSNIVNDEFKLDGATLLRAVESVRTLRRKDLNEGTPKSQFKVCVRCYDDSTWAKELFRARADDNPEIYFHPKSL